MLLSIWLDVENRLVLLDFDGTITRKDTLLEFIRFYCGITRFLIGFAILSPVLLALGLKLISNHKAKERVLRFFFAHTPVELFNARCREFATAVLPCLIRPDAEILFSEERKRMSMVAVVSASPENWVKPWCDAMNIPCLATRLEVIDQKISGRILGKNCYGEEKARRIKEVFRLEAYERIIAYGDSRGDKEMLELADEKHFGPIHASP